MARFCGNCGNGINEGSKFCPACGAKIPEVVPMQASAQASAATPTPVSAPVPVPEPAPVSAPAPVAGPVPGTRPNKQPTPPVAPKENKGLRIGLSFLFTFFALILFTLFFVFFAIYKATSTNIVAEAVSEIDISRTELGSLAEMFGNDRIDEDSTIAEALAVLITDNIDADLNTNQITALIEDENFSKSLKKIYGDIAGGIVEGKLDLNDITDDILDFAEDNSELIVQISGEEVSSEKIAEFREGIDKVRDGISEVGEINPTLGNFVNNLTVEMPERIVNSRAQVKQKAKKMQAVTVYVFLGLGVLFCGLIILMNRKKLGTGFRFVAILTMVIGLAQFGWGSLMRLIPVGMGSLIMKLSDLAKVFSFFSDIANGLVEKFIYNISDGVRAFAAGFFIFGVLSLITSIVLTSLAKKKAEI